MSNFPTLDGLNNISGDSADLNDIICQTFIATTSAQVPTMIAGSNDNNAASTAFVDDAITTATADLVTTNTSQTLTAGATKFFTSNPQSLTSAAPTLNNEYTNKKYVDDQISTAGGSFVTLGGTLQTITGDKNFTGTNILGDVFSVDQPCKTSITNNTISDTSVKGSIGGESVYHQMRMGARGFYIGQGVTNNGRQYFGISGSGAPDPDIVMVMTENGVKVQNANVGDTTDYTEALKVVGTSRFTGVGTFEVSPVCAVAPTTANQLVPKTYVDTNFTNLSGTQTITGNKTFTGNCVFWPTTGTTSIRGTQVDIFADTTFLTGNTTTISGVNGNFVSTNNYVGGTTTYLAATNTIINNSVNSFYIDASYNNFVGKETYINTPYFLVNTNCLNFVVQSAQTIMKSPYIAFTTDCTSLNINATNTNISGIQTITGTTNMTGSVATAFTQASSDNSTKVATTAFVNAYGNANYMTIGTNQSVSGIKTYSTKQVFNAGTASSTYDNTSLTDMTLASNSGNGILQIANGRIQTDTFGVEIASTLNLQLNEGTFIQPNISLSAIKEPVFFFGLNQLADYILIAPANTQYDATKKINTGIFSWFAGNNQSTLFTITHSIINNRISGSASYQELEVYFYFQDVNTGIIRYTTGNLATTTAFTMLPSSTFVRPTITFSLTTATLPQGAYSIFAYSRATGISVAGTQQVNWNLASPISSIATTQNYNTPVDYTFTSRNLYHNFRNYVAGVYIVNNIATQQNIMTPLFYSITNFTNMMFQPTISGAVSTPAVTGGTAAGNFTALSVNNADNYYMVYPNYSIILYDATGWTGTPILNFKNTTNNPVMVAPTSTQIGSSCRIYFDEVELIKY